MRRSPFLLEVFSDIPEKPRGGIWSIPFLYPLDRSAEYRVGGTRPIVQGKAQIAMGERDSPAGTGLSIRMHLRCPRSQSVTA